MIDAKKPPVVFVFLFPGGRGWIPGGPKPRNRSPGDGLVVLELCKKEKKWWPSAVKTGCKTKIPDPAAPKEPKMETWKRKNRSSMRLYVFGGIIWVVWLWLWA